MFHYICKKKKGFKNMIWYLSNLLPLPFYPSLSNLMVLMPKLQRNRELLVYFKCQFHYMYSFTSSHYYVKQQKE